MVKLRILLMCLLVAQLLAGCAFRKAIGSYQADGESTQTYFEYPFEIKDPSIAWGVCVMVRRISEPATMDVEVINTSDIIFYTNQHRSNLPLAPDESRLFTNNIGQNPSGICFTIFTKEKTGQVSGVLIINLDRPLMGNEELSISKSPQIVLP